MDWSAIIGCVFVACIAIVVVERSYRHERFDGVLRLGCGCGVVVFGFDVWCLALLAGIAVFDGVALRVLEL